MGSYGVIKGATRVPSLSRCHTATDTLNPLPSPPLHPCVSYDILSCLSCPPSAPRSLSLRLCCVLKPPGRWCRMARCSHTFQAQTGVLDRTSRAAIGAVPRTPSSFPGRSSLGAVTDLLPVPDSVPRQPAAGGLRRHRRAGALLHGLPGCSGQSPLRRPRLRSLPHSVHPGPALQSR